MPWKISILFYLSLGFSLCGFIFPSFVSRGIYPYGGIACYMVHWVYGFYIQIPSNPIEEITLDIVLYNRNIPGYFLISITIILLVVSFIELGNAKRGTRYHKDIIYLFAFTQIIASQYFEIYSSIVVMHLSSWGFYYSAIFASMGNKELKLFYVDEGIGSVKKAVSFILKINGVYIFLYWIFPVRLVAYSSLSSFVTEMLPALILYLVILFYGIYSLIRAILRN